MLFNDLLNFAGSLDAPTSNVSSSSPITLLLYVYFCPDRPALFPNRWFFLRAAIAGFFSCSAILITFIRPVLPRRTPWSSISAYKIELWRCGERSKDTNRPSTQLIEATSCVEKSNATMKVEALS